MVMATDHRQFIVCFSMVLVRRHPHLNFHAVFAGAAGAKCVNKGYKVYKLLYAGSNNAEHQNYYIILMFYVSQR
jgi:hypothetical protein